MRYERMRNLWVSILKYESFCFVVCMLQFWSMQVFVYKYAKLWFVMCMFMFCSMYILLPHRASISTANHPFHIQLRQFKRLLLRLPMNFPINHYHSHPLFRSFNLLVKSSSLFFSIQAIIHRHQPSSFANVAHATGHLHCHHCPRHELR